MIQITLDFEKDSTEPHRVFDAMSDLIQSVQSLHSCVIHSLAPNYRTELLLTDVKEGSIVSWLKPSLKTEGVEINKEEANKISRFLDFSTQKIIEFITDKETIKSKEEINELEQTLKHNAVDVEQFPNVFSLDRFKLLKGLSSIGKATDELHKEDQAYIEVSGNIIKINKNFNFSDNEAKKLLSDRVETFHGEKTLIIKKVDFLGNSMWDFILENRPISAKMLDFKWLDDFRHRIETIYPGDGLRCYYKAMLSYDKHGRPIEEKYDILKVLHKVDTMIDQHGMTFDE